jgi:hypothetical protein
VPFFLTKTCAYVARAGMSAQSGFISLKIFLKGFTSIFY